MERSQFFRTKANKVMNRTPLGFLSYPRGSVRSIQYVESEGSIDIRSSQRGGVYARRVTESKLADKRRDIPSKKEVEEKVEDAHIQIQG